VPPHGETLDGATLALLLAGVLVVV